MTHTYLSKGVIILVISLLIDCKAYAQWTPQSSSVKNDLKGVHFVSNSQGVAVGEKATIIVTSNGGSTWNVIQTGSTSDFAYKDVVFANDQTGFIAGYKGSSFIIRKTNDGGNSWIDKKQGGNYGLHAITFRNETEGIAVGDGGLIFHTQDGGDNFNKVNFSEDFHLYDAAMTGNAIYVAGQSGRIYKSSTSITNWKEQTAPPSEDLHSIYFQNEDTGYVAGNSGVILKTINGGQNWTSLNTSTSDDLNAIFFTSASTGYAVGEEGEIIATTNGGSTWNVQINGGNFKATLEDLHFPSQNVGFTVGKVDNFNTHESIIKKYTEDTPVYGDGFNNKRITISQTEQHTLQFRTENSLKMPYHLIIYNLKGQKMKSLTIYQHRKEIDFPNGIDGLHIYQLTTKEGKVKAGKIQIQ